MIFDAAALSNFRKTQESTMMHICTVEAYTVGGDGTISYGAPVTSVCGFKALNDNAGNRRERDLYEVITANAEMRLPLDVSIQMHDRVTLTHSFGTELEFPRHFEVCDLPDSFGPSGHVVRLKEVYS